MSDDIVSGSPKENVQIVKECYELGWEDYRVGEGSRKSTLKDLMHISDGVLNACFSIPGGVASSELRTPGNLRSEVCR